MDDLPSSFVFLRGDAEGFSQDTVQGKEAVSVGRLCKEKISLSLQTSAMILLQTSRMLQLPRKQ